MYIVTRTWQKVTKVDNAREIRVYETRAYSDSKIDVLVGIYILDSNNRVIDSCVLEGKKL